MGSELGVGVLGTGVDELDGDHGSEAAHISDDIGLGGHLPQARDHDFLDLDGALVEVLLAHRLDCAQRPSARDGVAAVGPTESALVDGVHQFCSAGDGGERHTAGDALRSGDDVRDDALVIAGEPFAGATEAALDLVGDEHDAGLFAVVDQRWQEALRRDDEAALTGDRLDDHRRDVLGADLLLDLGDGVTCSGCTIAAVAIRVGQRHAVDLGCEWTEVVLVRHVLGGQCHRQVRASVIRVLEGDDGSATSGDSSHLDRVLYRLSAGVEEC